MNRFKVIILFLLLLPTLTAAQKKGKKPSLPAAFNHARYVYVEAVDGEEFNPNLYPADRIAIADLKDAIHAWGRYTLTFEREKADLVFVVRKGRLASTRAGGDINDDQYPLGGPLGGQQGGRGPGPQRAGGPSRGVGGEVGLDDDLLKVCQFNRDGKLSGPLWIHSFANGLNAPRLILFAQLKDEVEKTYPIVPAGPPAKP
ncbi:MAG TPA: hypothetical protein VGT08_04440 [Terracidiphilus sp.]|nr:hypothetical protein [Terracidiphilus sp.]